MDPSMFNTYPSTQSIRVTWDGPCASGKQFRIKYHVCETTNFFDIYTKTNDVDVNNLQSSTLYKFNVYSEDIDTGSSVLLFTTSCKTETLRTNFLMENDISTADKTCSTAIFHLRSMHMDSIQVAVQAGNRADDETGNNDYIRICDMIAEYKPSVTTYDEKTLLLLGATGSGKSTWINALINYIAGVSHSEDHRFSIICKTPEERERSNRQYESQTTSVTLYRIPKIENMRVNCKVNIIDTPGFFDTRNKKVHPDSLLDFDKRIEKQIKCLFEKRVDHLDAILVVVAMSETKLTEPQEKIFSSIVRLFGNDVKQNIFIVMTKDDGAKNPECLPLINASGIPYTKYFRFNNADLFSKPSCDLDRTFWNRREDNFSDLFKELGKAPKASVLSSVEVMNARITLQLQLEALKNRLSELTQDVSNAMMYEELIESMTNNAKLKGKFECVFFVPKYTHQYTGSTALNCTYCKRTCHANCWVPLNILKWTCEVMTSNKCDVCDNQCDQSKHIRENYIYELTYEEQIFTNIDSLKRFAKEVKQSFAMFLSIIEKIDSLIDELRTKALKPDELSTEAYMKELIDRERNGNQKGIQSRIKILEKIIQHLQSKRSISKLLADILSNW